MSETTFENAKVGDRVWSITQGWGKITSINNTPNYPILAFFPSGAATFTIEGKYYEKHQYPILFWDEIPITPPPRPKRKVKKEISRWANVYTNYCSSLYNSEKAANAGQNWNESRIACVELKGTYEVEE